MFFKNEDDSLDNSLDRMELNTENRFISFYGMLYINTNNYLLIIFILFLFLSFYWIGFFFIFLFNWIRWYIINSEEIEIGLFLLNKNNIINEEFTSNDWRIRAEYTLLDLYGLVLLDFESLIVYSNLLFYYDLIYHGLYLKTKLKVWNNSFNFVFTNKNKIKRIIKNKSIKKIDKNIFKSFLKNNILFFKNDLKHYSKINYNLIYTLWNKNIFKKNNYNSNNFILYNKNYYSLKSSWWNK